MFVNEGSARALAVDEGCLALNACALGADEEVVLLSYGVGIAQN